MLTAAVRAVRACWCAALICFGSAAWSAPTVSAMPYADPDLSLGVTHITVSMLRAAQGIYEVNLDMPVTPGPVTLAYPEWIPGAHAPVGPVTHIAGLRISANGVALPWTRDPTHMYEFHVVVPPGVATINVAMAVLNIGNTDPVLVDMQWNSVLLYPLGHPVAQLAYQANLVLPGKWAYASALATESRNDDVIHFATTSLYALVDSPVMAGLHYRKVALATKPRVTLNLFADHAQLLATLSDDLVAKYRSLPAQEYAMFGGASYAHYDFLASLSDYVKNGYEHRQSSEVGEGAKYFATPEMLRVGGDLFTHEFTHAWNGKAMRPAGQIRPTYQDPRNEEGLWVYEGLTQYLGQVMAARIGIWSKQNYRDALAYFAAHMVYRRGRAWESLNNVQLAAPLRAVTSRVWANYTRRNGTDQYYAGVLLWLGVDAKIRQLTGDKKTLGTFCRLFFAPSMRKDMATEPFTLDDVVATLNAVAPFDWREYINDILHRVGPDAGAPLSGIEWSGWKLVFTDQQSPYMQAFTKYGYYNDSRADTVHDMYSIGVDYTRKGQIIDVLWDGPSFRAGVAPGMVIVAVNGRRFSPAALHAAIAASGHGGPAVRLRLRNQAWYLNATIDYHGGLRYPHLVRLHGVPDYLDEILAPVATSS